jgi:hypothetical protein
VYSFLNFARNVFFTTGFLILFSNNKCFKYRATWKILREKKQFTVHVATTERPLEVPSLMSLDFYLGISTRLG